MNIQPLIKICGISDSLTAIGAAKAGANFIGLVFDVKSRRKVSPLVAKKIVQAIKPLGVYPVGVFTTQTAAEIMDICSFTNINIVQLHGKVAKNAIAYLPKTMTKIFTISVDTNGVINDAELNNILFLSKFQDFILFDNCKPGSGRTFKIDNFSPSTDFKFFLAGGLNIQNVQERVTRIKPYGVDVSSGVEDIKCKKNITLIKAFIQTLKHEN